MRRWLPLFALLLSTTALAFGDGPEISRSTGKKGGVVVLWPRILAKSDLAHDAAAKTQQALATLARSVTDRVDLRPEPERACPIEKGCRAAALGAVLVAKDQGCAVVATVSAPGPSSQQLVLWSATVKLKAEAVPFRQPPEAQVVVQDFAPCADLESALASGSAAVAAALKQAMAATP